MVESPVRSFKPGDIIRENRQGAPEEEIMSVNGNMVSTYAGRMYHITKIVLVSAASDLPPQERL